MSDIRLISQTSAEWLAVVAMVQSRLTLLVEQILSPTLSDQQRRDLVQRHDELQQLLHEPAELQDRLVRESSPNPQSTY